MPLLGQDLEEVGVSPTCFSFPFHCLDTDDKPLGQGGSQLRPVSQVWPVGLFLPDPQAKKGFKTKKKERM